MAALGQPLSVWVYIYSVHTACSAPTPPARCVCLRGEQSQPLSAPERPGPASFALTFSSRPLSRQLLSSWKHQLLT